MVLLDAFRDHLDVLGLEPGRALVAVSGGPDSVALLDLLIASREAHGLELIVAHADHGIHPESGAIATRVEALAASFGLPGIVGHLGLGAAAGETAARAARYAWLERVSGEQGADLVFTAHHADDQVETVLMRVLAGSGPAGLAAMSARRGRLVRPLLPFRRAQLVQYLHSRGLTWWDDPANADPRHLRSWLRGTLLPQIRARLPEVDRKLLSVARQARLDREAWDELLDQLPELDWKPEGEGGSVAGAVLGRYDSPLAQTLVRAAARRAGHVLGPRRAARAVAFARSASSGSALELGAGWRLELAFGRLRFLAPPGAPAGAASLQVEGAAGKAQWGEWRLAWKTEPAPQFQRRDALTAWFIPGALLLRPWRPGEKLNPLGGPGRRPVVRCFQDAKVPRSQREAWPVLASEGRVVWIPGVCRSAQAVPIGGDSALRIDVVRA